MNDRAEVALTSNYSVRQSLTHEFNTTVNIPIPSTSPYYIPGLATTAGTALTLQYNLALNSNSAHPVDNRPKDQSLNTTLDARFDISENWRLSGSYTQGSNDSCGLRQTSPSRRE